MVLFIHRLIRFISESLLFLKRTGKLTKLKINYLNFAKSFAFYCL